MVEVRTRELVLESFPEIGENVWCATIEEWKTSTQDFNYRDDTPYTPTEDWSEITNCPITYGADESTLKSIRDEASQDSSYRFNKSSETLSRLLYPDALLDVTNSLDRIIEFKASFDEFIEEQEGSSFEKISALFVGENEEEQWEGGADNEKAFLAFGHTRETARTQRTILREIVQVTTAEFSIQAETRNSLGAKLSKLAEELIEVQKGHGFILENLYIGATAFTPLGYLDGAMSIIENFGLDDGGEWNSNWFSDFKGKYLENEYSVGLDSDTFESLATKLQDCLDKTETALTDGRAEIVTLAEEINSDYSGLTQGEVY
ncbi:hypothetical protein [Glycomyces buryatensis]|uniref:Uncharacterized protein n=1 Tax=Glycomyces buryatensis TaxID=2570927 RepID=A0A4S8QL13_9ACTN|nr:hypothetical protein [Glycomyces buryatensis]THV41414.1 hypothetical protein FAB82_11480 [Glycomyces buryatensis]